MNNERIAEVLDTLDEAIRRTELVIAKLEQIKQGLLHDLLTRGIDDNGELRDPDRHPEQVKDSPLGRIPRAWQTRDNRRHFGVRDQRVARVGQLLLELRAPHSSEIGNLTRDHINLTD